ISAPFSAEDFDNIAIPNPHGGEQRFDYNKNVLYHPPFSGWPTGAELAVRVVEVFNVLCGLGAVACTVLLARLSAPDRPLLWLASGLAFAAVPAFDAHMALVSNDGL